MTTTLQNKKLISLIQALFRYNPISMVLSTGLIFMTGFLEGVGILALLPVIELTLENNQSDPEGISLIFKQGLEYLGIGFSLGNLLLIVVFLMVLKAVVLFTANRIVSFIAVEFSAHKRRDLVTSLIEAKWPYFVNRSTGRISTGLTQESDQLVGLYMLIIWLFAACFQALFYALIALFTSPEILGFSLIVGIILFAIFKVIVTFSRKFGDELVGMNQSLNNKLIDSLNIFKPLKAMGQENKVMPFLQDSINNLKKVRYNLVLLTDLNRILQEPLIIAFLCLGLFMIKSYLDVSSAYMIFAIVIYYRLVGRISLIQTSVQKISAVQASFWSVDALIKDARSAKESNTDRKLQIVEFEKEIEFNNVSFSYHKNVLENLSLKIPKGQIISIFGPSGTGKTTLIDLLMALQKPETGHIKIDGQNLNEIDLSSWRTSIGLVPQDTILSNGSIYDNVTLYDNAFTEEEVWNALEQAEAKAFVQALPEGLHSVVGEHGSTLSGGQRQRIAIARALVRKPLLLILDEPTSALDQTSANLLMDTLKGLNRACTILIISHQEEVVRISDVVYKIEAGKIEALKN